MKWLIFLTLALHLSEIHGPTGLPIWLNAEDVVSMRDVYEGHAGHIAPNSRCILQTVDSRVLLSNESCTDVRQITVAAFQKSFP